MDEVWPEAQAHVARELGTGDPERDRLLLQHPRLPHSPGDRRAAPEPGSSGADHRRRIPQRPAPVRALGGGGLDRRRHGSPPSRSTISPSAFSPRRESGEHDLILVSQVLFGSGRMFDRVDELAGARPARGAMGGHRRLSRLHGARPAVRRGRCGSRFLSRRRVQICDVGRRLRLPPRARRLRRRARRSPAGSPSSRI